MKGKIVAIPFPFTNLNGAKVRPALVIYEGHEDVIVAFISRIMPLQSKKHIYKTHMSHRADANARKMKAIPVAISFM